MPDFFDLSRHLTSEERAIRDSVHKFVDARILPTIGEHFERGTFPTELIPEIAQLGLLGCNLQGYGCAGLSNVGYGLAMQELERGDSGIRSFASVQGSLVMYPIHSFGSEEQKTKLLPKMAKGEIIGCFGLTEPDFGSNPSGMLTSAVDDGDSYVINGTKRADHQRQPGADRARLGEGRRTERRGPRLPRADRRARFRGPRHPPQGQLACQRHKRAHSRGRAGEEGRDSSGRPRHEGAPLDAHRRALRHRVGRHRRGHGLLRQRRRLREAPRAVHGAAHPSPRTSSCRPSSPRR